MVRKTKKVTICIVTVLTIILLLTACDNRKYDKAVGSFVSSNGSTLEIFKIEDYHVTYEISIVGFPTVKRTDKIIEETDILITYYYDNGVKLPLIFLKYDENLDCWDNQAKVPGLDFYRKTE